MITQALMDLMIKKYDNYKVYIHNLANFDGIFLIKILTKLGYCKPIIHNDKIISITFYWKDYVIHFRDSKQLLIASLAKLGISFGVETLKTVFPYTFVNEDNLDYVGEVPEIKFFDNISYDGYNTYSSNFNNKVWSIKDETIKYCNIDYITLFQIILKFNELIFKMFNLNIHKYPTLSSLAFAIFRSNFMEAGIIPQISGQIEKDIRLSYTGGACDMYIPEGVSLFAYDVNSLYPSVMLNSLMPIGNPTYFEGNIRAIDQNAFGFFYCEITAPDNLVHPILQTHVKTNNGIRTMAPLGSWTGMIFSNEMDNAMKLGYKFNILWGYTFKSDYVFKEFVSNLYNLRLQYPKSNPLNYIAKLLLNSVYGRFGMVDSFLNVDIMDITTFKKFEKDFAEDIFNIIELDDKIMVVHRSAKKDLDTLLDNASETHNISIPIASAITAFARIHIREVKRIGMNLY